MFYLPWSYPSGRCLAAFALALSVSCWGPTSEAAADPLATKMRNAVRREPLFRSWMREFHRRCQPLGVLNVVEREVDAFYAELALLAASIDLRSLSSGEDVAGPKVSAKRVFDIIAVEQNIKEATERFENELVRKKIPVEVMLAAARIIYQIPISMAFGHEIRQRALEATRSLAYPSFSQWFHSKGGSSSTFFIMTSPMWIILVDQAMGRRFWSSVATFGEGRVWGVALALGVGLGAVDLALRARSLGRLVKVRELCSQVWSERKP